MKGRNSNADFLLTGGTHDVKPQMLSFSAAQSGADTTATTTQALPVLRNFQPSGRGQPRAQIVEVLKVYAELTGAAPAANASSVILSLGTKNNGTTNPAAAAPDVFARVSLYTIAAASGELVVDRVFVRDLTDGAGNGLLVATDNIYASVQSASTGNTNTFAIRILYRVYAASVQEYVGIVQGQQ